MLSIFSIFLLLAFSFSCSLYFSSSIRVDLKTEAAQQKSPFQLSQAMNSTRIDPSQVIQLSWRPRAFLYKGFLSDEECDHLISLTHDKLVKTQESGYFRGKTVASAGHSLSQVFLNNVQDEIISRIDDRISAWTFLPKENGEDMRMLHYAITERYEPHYDYYEDGFGMVPGGDRIATVLMHLSNVTRGGETLFPESQFKTTQPKDDTFSDCARTGYAVKPVKGNAVLFFNLRPNALKDNSSLHASCPVIEGEKWSATKWIHVRAFDNEQFRSSADDDCIDQDDNCKNWAALGECEKNSVYMIGTPDYYGTCRKSCGVC